MSLSRAKWHQLSADATVAQLNTSAACGLSHKAALSRAQECGRNTLFDQPGATVFSALRPFLTDPILILLFVSAVLTVCFAEVALGLCTLVCLLVVLGFSYRARRQASRLEARIATSRMPTVTVLRGGKRHRIAASSLVPGDILLLRQGDVVPCDCRLLSPNGLFVRTLRASAEGKPIWETHRKDADTVYPYGSEEQAPLCRNMLYGGSRILKGEARAVAVEIGEKTYLGAMEGFAIPCESSRKDGERLFSALRPYLRLYTLLLILLLLPLTLIGCLTSAATHTALGVFLSLCSAAFAGGYTVLSFLFSMILDRARADCFRAEGEENRVILKSDRALDAVACMTDLFLIGRAGVSDGLPHILGAKTVEDTFTEGDEKAEAETWRPLCEGMLLLLSATERSLDKRGERMHTDPSALRRDILALSGLDDEAMALRVSNSRIASVGEKERTVIADTAEGELRLRISRHPASLIRSCTLCEKGGRMQALSPEERKDFLQYIRQMSETGAECVAIAREHRGTLVLLGVLALGERVQSGLAVTLHELAEKGITVSLFLLGKEREELRFAEALPFPANAIESLFGQKEQEELLLNAYAEKRVYLGADPQAIAELIKTLRARGRCVGVLANRAEDLSLLHAADLSVATDSFAFFAEKLEEGLRTLVDAAGEPQSEDCAVTVRRHADLLLHRASEEGGGLVALSAAVSSCRAGKLRVRLLLLLLVASQFSRLLMTVFSSLSGCGLLFASQMLFCGFFAEYFLTAWLLALPISPKRLLTTPPFAATRLDRKVLLRTAFLPAAVPTVCAFFYAVILRCFGVLEVEALVTFFFFVLLLVSITLFLRSLWRNGAPVFSKRSLTYLLALLLPPVFLAIPSAFWPALQNGTGLGAWHPATAAALVFVPPITLLSARLLQKSGRTAK